MDGTTDAEKTYSVRVVCRAEDEARMRAGLLQAVSPVPLNLRGLSSYDVEGTNRTHIRATLTGVGGDHLVAGTDHRPGEPGGGA